MGRATHSSIDIVVEENHVIIAKENTKIQFWYAISCNENTKEQACQAADFIEKENAVGNMNLTQRCPNFQALKVWRQKITKPIF